MASRIETARRFAKKAEAEFAGARRNGDDVAIRQAAEKAWGAALQAAKALLEKRGVKARRGTSRIADALVELEKRDQRVARANVANNFSAYLQRLHADCFGDGIYSVKTIERDIRKVSAFISTISRL